MDITKTKKTEYNEFNLEKITCIGLYFYCYCCCEEQTENTGKK